MHFRKNCLRDNSLAMSELAASLLSADISLRAVAPLAGRGAADGSRIDDTTAAEASAEHRRNRLLGVAAVLGARLAEPAGSTQPSQQDGDERAPAGGRAEVTQCNYNT